MLTHNPIPACASNLLCRTALAREIAFDPALKHFADWDFAVRLIDAAPGARVRDVLVGYVLHDESMHVAGLSGVDAEFRYLRDRHGREGRQLGSVAVTRWIAAGHRAAGHRGRAAIAYVRGALRYRSPAGRSEGGRRVDGGARHAARTAQAARTGTGPRVAFERRLTKLTASA